jgi:hypothetical protein
MSQWLSQVQVGRTATTASVLVLLVLWESVAPCFPYFLRRGRERIRHGARNLTLGLINGTLTALASV